LLTTLASIGYFSNHVNATQSDFRVFKSAFGPIIGLTVNDTGNVDWLMSGTWRSILTNNLTGNPVLYDHSPGTFTTAIEMIRPDGTDRHTHALTHFILTDRMQNADNNSTVINGTSTISLLGGPELDVPTTIERSNNGHVFVITIDPESVNYHFGKSPFIYGVSANPESMKSQNSPW